jgi:hypothetical protein
MADTLAFIDERLSNSITAAAPPASPIDRLQPLAFTEWLRYNSNAFTTTTEFLTRYQSYLTNWYAVKQVSQQTAADEIQGYYVNLINDIVLNYSTADEKRFLKNIDTNNSRDLAAAIPFFAKKIKDICLYYSTLRDDASTAVVRYNLKGSNTGIESLLYSFFLKSLDAKDLVDQFNALNLSLPDIRNNLVIAVEDLYDTYPNYYDISPTLPASAYDVSSGLRNSYFNLNQHDIDPYLFGNENQSILRAILSYPFYLTEIGPDLSIDPLVNSSQLNLLKDSDFTGTVNDGQASSLNLVNERDKITKYIGNDFYYIATSSTATSYTSGQLFTADSEFANYLNKRYPTVAAVPSSEFLKTARQVGLFFKPDKIGLINFTNFNFTASIDLNKLAPNTVYYFPDPSKYGNISGNAKIDFMSPLDFFEENYFNKVDFSNQYKMGDVATDPYYQTFRAYQSREQSLRNTNFGVSRYTDSQDFFNGEYRTLWSNADVYPTAPISQYPIDTRFETLLPINKTLFQYKSDVYGNEYGLYKSAVNKRFFDVTWTQPLSDYILQGGLFTTPTTAYDTQELDLGYSGVTINTSASIPASFNDGGNPIVIKSYNFDTSNLPESVFTTLYTTNYVCYSRDCQTFVASDSTTLPDDDSDVITYNPNSSNLYYNTLADAAPHPGAPNGVSNLQYQASFLINNLQYVDEDYDCGDFYIEDLLGGACDNILYTHSYTEPSNYRDIPVPSRKTVVDLTLSGINTNKKSLYYTRNIESGDFYFRNINSTIIGPASAALSGAFINYPTAIREEINNRVINFDVYYDVLQIETENYTVFDKLQFDYDSNRVTGSVKEVQALVRGSNPELEKFSNTWFNETEKALYLCKTTLLTDRFSASNYKVVYPEIYKVNLINQQTTRIYPAKKTEELTFDDLSLFSLYGKNLEVNIVTIEKPVLTYNDENAYYNLSYLGKDAANTPYLVTTRFQYINNTIINVTCTMHKPATDVYDINFSNPEGSPYFDTYTLLGSAAGYLDTTNNTFAFGAGTTGDLRKYDDALWSYFQDAGIANQTARLQLSSFVIGLKDLGIWDNTACWVMRRQYNMGSGTVVYGFGGLGTYNGQLSASGVTAYNAATGTDYPIWEPKGTGIRFSGTNGLTVPFERKSVNKHTVISVAYNEYSYNNPTIDGIQPYTGSPIHISTSLSSSDYGISLYSATSGQTWQVTDTYNTPFSAITEVSPPFITTDSLSGKIGFRFEAMQHDPLFVSYTRDNDTITINTSRYTYTYDRLEISGKWVYDGVGNAYPKRAISSSGSLGWPGIQAVAMVIDQSVDVQAVRTLLKNTICSDLNLE